MWSLIPARGDPVDLEILVPSREPAVAVSAVYEAGPQFLSVRAPVELLLPRDLPLGSVRVTARWTDSGGGLCVMSTVVAEADPRDSLTPWLLVATGEITRIPRRKYVREQVSGRVRVAPLASDEGRGASGDVVDLSEGGVCIQSPLVEGLYANSAVRIVAEFADHGAHLDLCGRVVRVEPAAQYTRIAVEFEPGHHAMDRIRGLVFAAQRERLLRERGSGESDGRVTSLPAQRRDAADPPPQAGRRFRRRSASGR